MLPMSIPNLRSRAIAAIIDALIILGLSYALYSALGKSWFDTRLFAIPISLIYHTIGLVSPLQGSIGKYFMGMKVISIHGNKIPFGWAIARAVFRGLVSFMGAGLVIAAFDPNNRGPHDKVCGTIVVIQ